MRRPRWRRRLVIGLAVLVALRLAGIAAFRSWRPAVLDRIRRFNRAVLNPAMLHLAGRPHWYAARLDHVGRRSGRAYTTPVVAVPVAGGFAIPLPYGTDVDWHRNVQKAGTATLRVHGVTHTITEPHNVDVEAVRLYLPQVWRWAARLYDMRQWLRVEAAPVQPLPEPVDADT